jgi:hypothetical protein
MLQSKAGSFSMLKKRLELPVRLFLFLYSALICRIEFCPKVGWRNKQQLNNIFLQLSFIPVEWLYLDIVSLIIAHTNISVLNKSQT